MKTTILPSPLIFDHAWTPGQLLALSEANREAQLHTDYASAAKVISLFAGDVDLPRIRAMVGAVMGGTGGIHYICGALQGAHVAISLPRLFTDRQLQLLLAPLGAVEEMHQTSGTVTAA